MNRLRAAFAREHRSLWIVGAAAFLAGGLASLPATMLAAAAKARSPFLEIGAAEGTIWRGAFIDAAHDGLSLGRIDYRLSALSLLSGRMSADAAASGGALSANGRISAGVRRIEVSGLDARFNLAAIRRYTIFGLRYQGVAQLTAEKIVLSEKTCEAEGVEIATNALDPLARRWSGEGLPLKGAARCESGELVFALVGENREGGVELTVRIRPDLSYAMTVMAEPRRAEVGAALRAAGFEGDNGALAFRATGRLRGLTS
ncbi:MAG: type II secretion system protein N [Parvularculaceae bacterium]|nr:type II secretion system protein N [Parvularculaceae bacterium]